jgi:hypothetical protein
MSEEKTMKNENSKTAETTETAEPVRRGRPKGSKNTVKPARRGRPKGSKNSTVSFSALTRLVKKTDAARTKLKKLEKTLKKELKKMAIEVAG